jgi:hypothetical protein
MKINQNDSCWTCYNTKIFKTSRGFSSKLKPYNSVNLAIGRACFYEQFCSCQLYLKKPSENQNVDRIRYVADLSRFKIRHICRTRVQSAAARASNSSYYSNTCAKCSHWSAEFVVFLEHVGKVQPLELRIRRILRTRVQSAAVRAPNLLYSSNTCAKCSQPLQAPLR